MPDLTPREAAEMLEDIAAVSDLKAVDGKRSGLVKIGRIDAEDLRIAASCLRKIAAGEYKQVVHCEKCQNFDRKEGMWYDLDGFCERANKFVSKDFYCGFGALMDGKDDSHE